MSWVPVVAAVVPGPEGPAPSPGGWAAGMAPDLLLDAAGQPVDLDAEGVDVVQQHPRQLAMVVIEAAGQRRHQRSALAAHPSPGQLGEHLGVTLPGDERLQHGPPGDPMMSVATVPSLIRASSSSSSSRCMCRARSPVRSDRSRV
jgi:hypothetical protein